MKLTPQEEQTVQAYNQNAKAWAVSRNKKGDWSIEKNTFQGYLPSGKLLEIGSGGGRDARELIEMGYEYKGTDVSFGLLEEAKKNNPGATFLLQSVYDLDFSEAFDGFWACAVLLHIPKDRIDEALKSIHKTLKKGAIGFISLKKGTEEKFVEGDHAGINYKRFFSFWQLDEFSDALTKNNFHILESYEIIHADKPWLIFFVRAI